MPENMEPRYTQDDIKRKIQKMLPEGVKATKFNWSGPLFTDPVLVVYTGLFDDETQRSLRSRWAVELDVRVTFEQRQIG